MSKKLSKKQEGFWNTLKTPAKELNKPEVFQWQADMIEMMKGYAKNKELVVMCARQGGKSRLTEEFMRQMYGRALRK